MVVRQTTRKQVAIIRNRQLNKLLQNMYSRERKIPGKEEKINRDQSPASLNTNASDSSQPGT